MQWLWVGVGAALGAILRALLTRFNTWHAWLPYGTLFANLIGGLLMGAALVMAPKLSPSLRLFIMTGFLGGLTTFSTFSAEVLGLLMAGKLWQGFFLIVCHVCMTLLATAIGFYGLKLLLPNL
ncbi:MAG: fluoride efflux transporter CrcB [Moraxella sp.]|jgi:CrcB protein